MVANYGTGLLANYDIFPVANFITYFHKYHIFSYNRSYGAENEGHDMKVTFDYFEELKEEDPNFFYEFTLDNDGRVEHMFWVDGEARRLFARMEIVSLLTQLIVPTNIACRVHLS
jgi:hypothetical protein